MIKKLKNLKKDELVKGGIVLFVMINISNFLNYVYQVSMVRMLGAAKYGVFAVLMSVVYVFTVPNEAIQTALSRITSRFNPKKEFGKMKFIFYKALKKSMKISLICFVLFIPIAIFLAYFLPGITFLQLIFTGIVLLGVFSIPVTRGILQGRKKFKGLGWNMIIEAIVKVGLAIGLVFIGLGVYGAISAVILSIFVSFIISLFFIKEIIKSKKKKTKTDDMAAYSKPILWAIFVIIIMMSLDIILAKRFFPAELAGKYAIVSMLGKIIFFGTYAVGKAMFPIASESYEKGEDSSQVFKRSMKFVVGLSLLALIVYLFFPKLILRILFGPGYSDVSDIVFIVGLAFSFLSISNIAILYCLSINKIKRSSVMVIFVFLEIVFMSYFNKSLMEFSLAFLAVNFLMFVYSISLLK